MDAPETGTIRVLIADDEAVLRNALADLVTSDDGFELVGAARDADEAIALAEATRPDVALIDVRMPGGGGLRVAQELQQRAPDIRVIAHTAVDDRATVVRMLHGGAVGYLVKGTSPADILGAIRGAARGQSAMSPDVMSGLVRDLATRLEREEVAQTSRRERIQRISAAIEGEDRSLAFQPIVELEGSARVGVEALARFTGEPTWSVPRWFAEAADAGLAVELELACIRDALSLLARLPGGTYLSVNASHVTAGSTGLLALLDPVDTSRVVVEITEHERVEDYERLTTALMRLRERGARVAVDDAGAGFASLRHLLLIDPEIIKLDVSLTQGIDTDPRKRALAAALTSFAEEMTKIVVAEGVETSPERRALLDLGVSYGQGYFLGRPAPFEEIVEAS
ncbi:MAG TPA: EAL domain-containing protein [Actinomycetota bacterium]|jgi:EAL domain-containing protein (putative c-di-GMP-specific phosphodiesterase class I)|nr:EAL domain-containing protein [Actinomycetota bacterium]